MLTKKRTRIIICGSTNVAMMMITKKKIYYNVWPRKCGDDSDHKKRKYIIIFGRANGDDDDHEKIYYNVWPRQRGDDDDHKKIKCIIMCGRANVAMIMITKKENIL